LCNELYNWAGLEGYARAPEKKEGLNCISREGTKKK